MTKIKKYPFPFLGAGKANYTEWCEVHIKFKTAPSSEQKKKILRNAPKPFMSDFTVLVRDTLEVRTYEDLHSDLEEIYGSSIKTKSSRGGSSESLVDRFEKELEQWLLETNQVCPIELAYRYEPDTKLSEWHKESCKLTGDLLTLWTGQQHGKEWHRLQNFVNMILEYAEKQIPKNIVE